MVVVNVEPLPRFKPGPCCVSKVHSDHSQFRIIYTLLKIIKGIHVRNGIAALPDILPFMHDVCLIG